MKKLILILLFATIANATTYLHVTVDGAGAQDGVAWSSSMGMSQWFEHMINTVSGDTVYYVKSGTYVVIANFATTRPGTSTAPISIIGVMSVTEHVGPNVVSSDYAYGSDRPLIEASTYTFTISDYYDVKNLQITTAYTNGLFTGAGCNLYNCKSTQSGAATKNAFYLGNNSSAIRCEAISTNGNAIRCSNGARIVSCYIHSSSTGILTGIYASVVDSIIDTCVTGMNLGSVDFACVNNNTIFSCSVGITATDSIGDVFFNNIISQCTDGAVWTTDEISNVWQNNLLNNTDNEDLATQSVVGTNLLLDVGTQCLGGVDDFRLIYSPARSGGLMLTTSDGLNSAGFNVNVGVDQTGIGVYMPRVRIGH